MAVQSSKVIGYFLETVLTAEWKQCLLETWSAAGKLTSRGMGQEAPEAQ